MMVLRCALAAVTMTLLASSLRADVDRADVDKSSYFAEPESHSDDSEAAVVTAAAEEEKSSNSNTPSSSCADFCSGDCCCPPLWTAKVGAVILQRSTPHSSPVIENTTTGATVLDASDFTFNWAAGPDVSLIRQLASGRSVEVRYFSVDGWRSSVSGVTPAIWQLPTNPPLFGLGVAAFDSVYASRLYNFEVNLRQASANYDWLTWLAGFRWLQVGEDLATAADFGGNQADIVFSTLNNLYGGQVGADLSVWRGDGPFRVDSVFKAGLFGNAASNRMSVTQQIGPAFGAADQEGQLSFVGEIGATAVYQWTDQIAIRGGYQVLWIEGLAVASDQPVATNVIDADGIGTGGGIFYHGAMASLDFNW